MKKILLLAVTALLLASMVACSVPTAGAAELKSDKPRITSPPVVNTELSTQVGGNTAFALDLYQQLRTEDGNVFYSPYIAARGSGRPRSR